MSATHSDPAQIERELDATRSRLGGHLDELQNRLSPGQMLDDLMAHLRTGGGADFGRNLLETVKTNPVPAALTGIGIAWLMASGPRTASPEPYVSRVRWNDDMADRLRAAEYGVERSAEEPEDSYADRLAAARGNVIGVARGAQETASGYAARISVTLTSLRRGVTEKLHDAGDALANARDSAGSALGNARDGIGNAAGSVGAAVQGGGRAAGNLAASIGDSPVLLGALGLAAGALLGALLPISEQEEAQLGGMAGQLRDQAASTAQDLMDKGGQVASAAWQAGRDAASENGLGEQKTPGGYVDAALHGDLADKASRGAHESLRAGDEALRGQFGAQGGNGSTPPTPAGYGAEQREVAP